MTPAKLRILQKRIARLEERRAEYITIQMKGASQFLNAAEMVYGDPDADPIELTRWSDVQSLDLVVSDIIRDVYGP